LEYRKLGNLEIATIGLGTLRTFDMTSDEDIAVRSQIVDNCLANDINFIDCASAYGNAEKIVGTTTQDRGQGSWRGSDRAVHRVVPDRPYRPVSDSHHDRLEDPSSDP